MIGFKLVTKQTGEQGVDVSRVSLVTRASLCEPLAHHSGVTLYNCVPWWH